MKGAVNMLKIVESKGTGTKDVTLETGATFSRTLETFRKNLSTFDCDTGEKLSVYESNDTLYGIVSTPVNGFYAEQGCIIL